MIFRGIFFSLFTLTHCWVILKKIQLDSSKAWVVWGYIYLSLRKRLSAPSHPLTNTHTDHSGTSISKVTTELSLMMFRCCEGKLFKSSRWWWWWWQKTFTTCLFLGMLGGRWWTMTWELLISLTESQFSGHSGLFWEAKGEVSCSVTACLSAEFSGILHRDFSGSLNTGAPFSTESDSQRPRRKKWAQTAPQFLEDVQFLTSK